MTDIGPRKLAVEVAVDDDGLAAAETAIKEQLADDDAQRHALLGHARKYADEREEVEA